jgi:hypothetical protein
METFAPIFNGFYETAYSFDVERYDITDWLFGNDYTENQKYLFDELIKRHYDAVVKENYNEYCVDVAKAVCEFLSKKTSELVNMNVEFEFQNIYSPQYYNFKNDSINVNIKTDECLEKAFVKHLLDFIKNHIGNFQKYIESNYTSYDGFCSFYSNNYNDWIKNEYNAHELGSLLEFALREKFDDIETEMMYYVLENVCSTSYCELNRDFQMLIDNNELDLIFAENNRLINQKNLYFDYMKEKNQKPNYKAIEIQEKKNYDELCNDIIKLLEK